MPHSLCIHRCLLSIKNSILLAAGIFALLSVQGPGRFLAADDLRYSSAGDGSTPLFQFPPETAEDAVEAARIAIGLDRPADARGFLRQLIERDAQAPEMIALRRRFGLAMLIDLRRDARLQPEAGQLLKQMQSALPQLTTADLNDRIELLGSGLAAAEDAQFDLIVAGPATLPLLLARTPSTRSGRAAANLLETLAFDWRHDLTNLLPSADLPIRLRIYELLAGSAAHDLHEILLRQQFTATEPAEVAAARAALRRLARGAELPATADAAADHLLKRAEQLLVASGARFAAADPSVAATGLPADELPPLIHARLLLEHALAIQPAHPRGVLLQQLAAAAGPPENTPAGLTGPQSPEQRLAALQAALELGQATAALTLLKSLDPDTLKTTSLARTTETVLRKSLDSPDARVRTVAAAIALRAGLEHDLFGKKVREQIVTAASRGPRPEAVVIMADPQPRLLFQHLMEDQGFLVDTAGTGPEGFLMAASQLQCEYVLLSLQPSRWSPSMTIANLRADVRTRLATVILVGLPASREQAHALIETYGNAVFLEQPVGSMTFNSRLKKLRLPDPVVSAADRIQLQQSTSALLIGR